jgi:hypothetical protein
VLETDFSLDDLGHKINGTTEELSGELYEPFKTHLVMKKSKLPNITNGKTLLKRLIPENSSKSLKEYALMQKKKSVVDML